MFKKYKNNILISLFAICICVGNIYASSDIVCLKCGSKNIRLYRTNSKYELEERIYLCKDCGNFFSNIIYSEEIANIISSQENDDNNKDTIEETKKDSTTTTKSVKSSEKETEQEYRDNTIYDVEPEGNYYIGDKHDKVARTTIKNKDIKFDIQDNGTMRLIDKTKTGTSYYIHTLVTVVDDNNNKILTWYFDVDGVLQTGWKLIDGSWYFFSDKPDAFIGNMLIGQQNINGKMYYFDANGQLLSE